MIGRLLCGGSYCDRDGASVTGACVDMAVVWMHELKIVEMRICGVSLRTYFIIARAN